MQTRSRFSVFWLFSSCSATITLLYLCLTPAPPQLAGPFGWDKLQHASAFGFLAFLYFKVLETRQLFKTALLQAALAAICFGGLIEILQKYLTESRKADWFDFAADVTGVIFTITMLLIFRRIRGLI